MKKFFILTIFFIVGNLGFSEHCGPDYCNVKADMFYAQTVTEDDYCFGGTPISYERTNDDFVSIKRKFNYCIFGGNKYPNVTVEWRLEDELPAKNWKNPIKSTDYVYFNDTDMWAPAFEYVQTGQYDYERVNKKDVILFEGTMTISQKK